MRPLGIPGSIVLFIIPAGILYFAHFVFIPAFVERSATPYLTGYLIAWTSTMALFLVASLLGYKLEGNPHQWRSLASRFRLAKMTRADWLWALALLAISMGLYLSLAPTAPLLARIPIFAPHPVMPPDFGPAATTARVPGILMEMPLAGRWWIALAFLFGWLLNVFGEEFWFRGYLLPRQELAMGARAWIANGLMFGLNHIWQPWNLALIAPAALLGAYIVQKRRNTWILIIMHGLMNLILVVVVVLNVAGVLI